jgi:multiple sugar transport system substrate-binding protein
MRIDPHSPTPLYSQLKELLLADIRSGRYPPGERLPTEHQLCQTYGISRTPAMRALSELAEEGVVVRHRRRGTFVNVAWLERNAERPVVTVVVPDGPWEAIVRSACPTHLNAKVTSVPTPHLHRELLRAVGEGVAPDLAILDSVWIAEFAAAGFLWPLADLDDTWVAEVLDADFLEPFASAYRVHDRAYAVQAEADVAGLWYRTAEVERHVRHPPSRWTQWRDLGVALRDAGWGDHALVVPGGTASGETATYCLLALLASNGAAVLGPTDVTVASPRTVAALGFLHDLVDAGVLSAACAGMAWDEPIAALAAGKAAMSLGGSYDGRHLAEETGRTLAEITEDFGFVPVPGGPDGAPATLAGGLVYGIMRQSRQPLHALALLDALVAPDALAGMARSTGQIPPRRTAVQLAAADLNFLAATAGFLDHAVVRPATPAYHRVSAQLQEMMEAVLTGHRGPTDAARWAAGRIAAITGHTLPQTGA